ncbi:MAG: hypothetical protein Q9M75_04930 [Ghiorsea sp.]|nr:hypothetical protein [Ghiorsea sp.]
MEIADKKSIQRRALKSELKKICRLCFGSEKKAARRIFYNDFDTDVESEVKAFEDKFKKQLSKSSKTSPDLLEKYIEQLLNAREAQSYKLSQEGIGALPTVKVLQASVALYQALPRIKKAVREKNEGKVS